MLVEAVEAVVTGTGPGAEPGEPAARQKEGEVEALEVVTALKMRQRTLCVVKGRTRKVGVAEAAEARTARATRVCESREVAAVSFLWVGGVSRGTPWKLRKLAAAYRYEATFEGSGSRVEATRFVWGNDRVRQAQLHQGA